MNNAIPEIMHFLLSLFLFVLSTLALFKRVDLEQELVKTFSKTNYARNELQLMNGKSEYHDYWNGNSWESPNITIDSQEIVNEIYSLCSPDISVYVNETQIPVDVIAKYKKTGNGEEILSYINNGSYIKIYEYDNNDILKTVRYSS